MTCAVFCIGTEITRGELVNTNAAWLSTRLTELGFEVVEECVVDDDMGRIVSAFERLAKQHDIIVATGGLGPTTDDLTTAAVARAIGKNLETHAESLEHIRRRLEKYGRMLTGSNAKQADFPAGSTVLQNPIGTAPGFSVTHEKARAFFMPGVPREMKRMFDEEIVPHIRALAPNEHHQVRLRTFGLPESLVGEKLAGVEAANPGIVIGYRAHFPEIEVKVLARAKTPTDAKVLCDRVTEEVRSRLVDVVYGEGEESFASVLSKALRAKHLTLAVAESCTGGLVGNLLTRESGASDFFLFDAVTYANAVKTSVLGVSEDLLRAHGAVSAECAAAMAEGARRVSGADVAVSVTGIAGPSGGSEEKPVGTVYFATSTKHGTATRLRNFGSVFDRGQIQTLAAYAAMALVRDLVKSEM